MKKRAVSAAEKKVKEKRILNTAAGLFHDGDFDSVSIARIAQDAGIAKGTFFLYFSSKEELFLSLTEQYLHDWVGEAGTFLVATSLEGGPDMETAAEILASSLGAKEDLLRLLSILHCRLLAPGDADQLDRFRKVWNETLASLEVIFSHVKMPAGSRGWKEVLQDLYILIIGVQSTCAVRGDKESGPAAFIPLFYRMTLEYLRGLASGVAEPI